MGINKEHSIKRQQARIRQLREEIQELKTIKQIKLEKELKELEDRLSNYRLAPCGFESCNGCKTYPCFAYYGPKLD